MEPTEIEKKSLEAHVELCAERYNTLEHKLEALETKLAGVGAMLSEVRDSIASMSEKRNDQILGWGLATIGALVGTIGWLIVHYVLK